MFLSGGAWFELGIQRNQLDLALDFMKPFEVLACGSSLQPSTFACVKPERESDFGFGCGRLPKGRSEAISLEVTGFRVADSSDFGPRKRGFL